MGRKGPRKATTLDFKKGPVTRGDHGRAAATSWTLKWALLEPGQWAHLPAGGLPRSLGVVIGLSKSRLLEEALEPAGPGSENDSTVPQPPCPPGLEEELRVPVEGVGGLRDHAACQRHPSQCPSSQAGEEALPRPPRMGAFLASSCDIPQPTIEQQAEHRSLMCRRNSRVSLIFYIKLNFR